MKSVFKKIWKGIKAHPLAIVIVAIGVIICALNYTPGTFLTGWDTLHNEFNFPLSFNRNIFGVWREYQGLGAVAAHAEPSDLPRQILLFLESFILPLSFLRYSYVFLTLILGPLGVYFLVDQVILAKFDKDKRQLAGFIAALYYLFNLATVQLFYVPFEMFQAQYAFLPWLFLFLIKYFNEGKSKHLIWFFIFSIFALPQAYAAALFYAYIGALGLFLLVQIAIGGKKLFKTTIKRSLIVGVVTFIVNAYWLLPNIYYVIYHSKNVPKAIINQVFSAEAFAYNEKFGSLNNVALLRNFLFDWNVFNFKSSEFTQLLEAWKLHLTNPLVISIGYLMVILIGIGIYYAIKKKSNTRYGFLAILAFSLFMIININFPTGPLFKVFISLFGFLQEAFRFVFNKFATITLMSYAVFLSFGVLFILDKLKSKNIQKIIGTILVITILFFGLPAFQGEMIGDAMRKKIPNEYFQLYDWFKDKQVNGRIAKLPIDSFAGWIYYKWGYQGAGFLWFNLKAPLLDRDFDRWIPYNEQYYWEMSHAMYSRDINQLNDVLRKYQIEWVILDRNVIDPGKKNNDSLLFYDTRQMFTDSWMVQKAAQFNDIEVYKVKQPNNYTSFIYSPSSVKEINVNAIKDFYDYTYSTNGDYMQSLDAPVFEPFHSLYDNESINKYADETGYYLEVGIPAKYTSIRLPQLSKNLNYIPIDIKVSKTDNDDIVNIILTPILPEIFPNLPKIYLNKNSTLNQTKDYVIQINPKDVNYLTVNESDKIAFRIPQDNKTVKLGESRLSMLIPENTLVFGNKNNETIVTKHISKSSLANFLDSFKTDFELPEGSTELIVKIPKHSGYLSRTYQLTKDRFENDESLNIDAKRCAKEKIGEKQSYSKTWISEDNREFTRYSSVNTSSCDAFGFWDMSQDNGYLVSFENRNISGFPLYVCIANYYSNKCDQRIKLNKDDNWHTQILVQPPMNTADVGYGVSIDNLSFNKIPTINDLASVSMQAFPYKLIKQIQAINPTSSSILELPPAQLKSVWHPNPAFYKIELAPQKSPTLLALNQSYEKNWVAIPIEANGHISQLKPYHTILNNWANVWVIPENTTQVIVLFIPQVAQLIGEVLLISVIISLLTLTTAKAYSIIRRIKNYE